MSFGISNLSVFFLTWGIVWFMYEKTWSFKFCAGVVMLTVGLFIP